MLHPIVRPNRNGKISVLAGSQIVIAPIDSRYLAFRISIRYETKISMGTLNDACTEWGETRGMW